MDDREPKIEDLEAEADRLEQRSKEVGEHADQAESDWEAKKTDESVPGAQPSEEERSEDAGGGGPANAAEQ